MQMETKIRYTNQMEDIPLRDAWVETMAALMEEDPSVMDVEPDMTKTTGIYKIMDRFPGRIVNVGIAESNMIGMAAGLASTGKKVYAHSFASFAVRRPFDQIFISAAYAGQSIRIYGSDPGIYALANGGTHMPFEDVGLMRTIPNATIFDISDAVMMRKIARIAKDLEGIVYIRAGRAQVPSIYPKDTDFEVGKGKVIIDGKDVAIFTGGIMVSESIKAAEELDKRGISAAVIDMFTIKPVDKELIIAYAKKTGAIVTTDNHNANGGLGDAVASVLGEYCPTPLCKLAINDEFGQVATSLDYLRQAYHLNAAGVIEKVECVLRKKFN